MPHAGLQVSRGGANNKLIFFAHDLNKGWSVYTRDKKALKLLERAQHGHLAGAVQNVRRGERKRVAEWFLFLLVILGIVAGAWMLKDPVIELIANFVPKSWESKAGDVIYSSIQTSSKIVQSDEVSNALKTVTAPLLESVKDSGYEFKLHIAEDDDLNAFAVPGGHVIIHSSVILRAENAEELLGVLGHEIAHVTKRHSVKQIFSVLGIYFVFDVFFGNFAGTFAALTQAAPYLLQQGFSRDHEREADDQGFEYLIAANINPSGMVTFFKRLNEEEGKNSVSSSIEKHLNFLSTHPGTEERIAALEEKVKAHAGTKYRDVSAGFKELQEKLKAELEK